MNKVQCGIINDLLPLYTDHVCSEESKKMVEEHLVECSYCKNQLENMQGNIYLSKDVAEENRKDVHVIGALSDFWTRSKLKAFMKGVVMTTLAVLIVFLGYIGLFQWNVTTVPTSLVEVKDVSRLANGNITFHIRLIDGYNLMQVHYDMDEKGNFYLTPHRPVIKTKSKANIGLQNMYYIFDEVQKSAYREKYGNNKEITALYFGTRKDKVLIWKKGMDLPAASKEMEQEFTIDYGSNS